MRVLGPIGARSLRRAGRQPPVREATFAPLIGKNLGVKKVPITFRIEGKKRSAEIPGIILQMSVDPLPTAHPSGEMWANTATRLTLRNWRSPWGHPGIDRHHDRSPLFDALCERFPDNEQTGSAWNRGTRNKRQLRSQRNKSRIPRIGTRPGRDSQSILSISVGAQDNLDQRGIRR